MNKSFVGLLIKEALSNTTRKTLLGAGIGGGLGGLLGYGLEGSLSGGLGGGLLGAGVGGGLGFYYGKQPAAGTGPTGSTGTGAGTKGGPSNKNMFEDPRWKKYVEDTLEKYKRPTDTKDSVEKRRTRIRKHLETILSKDFSARIQERPHHFAPELVELTSPESEYYKQFPDLPQKKDEAFLPYNKGPQDYTMDYYPDFFSYYK